MTQLLVVYDAAMERICGVGDDAVDRRLARRPDGPNPVSVLGWGFMD